MGKLTEHQHNILGLPSRTPEETVTVIDGHTRRDGVASVVGSPIGTRLRIRTNLKRSYGESGMSTRNPHTEVN